MIPQFSWCILASLLLTWSISAADTNSFVRVSPRDPRYFELSDGQPYIPIGLNMIAPDTRDAEGLARMEEWITKLSANGGNYIRVWASSPFWDIEHEKSGVYDEAKAQRLDALLKIAASHGVKVKLTLEHFREMSDQPQQRWANKPLHTVSNGGTATNMADFFSGEASRDRFRQKLAWLSNRYGDNPAIFGWELWNEVNAVKAGSEAFMPWTETMLAELHKRFPHNLAVQSLGSYDTQGVRELYRRHSLMPGNDVAQVHRYLDQGAHLEICRGPVDVLASDAVRDLLSFNPERPVVLAESGAVEPSHSGPSKLYAKDKDGVLLHDILFAPFFSGAAGAGQIWHWDTYVSRNNLWPQFARFAAIVKDLDPAAEAFEVKTIPHERLRIYVLQGRKTVLVWCRDSKNTWRTELEEGQPPEILVGVKIDLSTVLPKGAKIRCYDPWKDQWGETEAASGVLTLPSFSRSLVVRATVDR